MMNIGSFHPSVNTRKASKYRQMPQSAAVAGSETNPNPPKITVGEERRRRKDRRTRNVKPLIDMRCGRDRRDSGKLSINIEA